MEEFGAIFVSIHCNVLNFTYTLSYVPPGRSGSSSPVPAYSGSSPESRVSGLFQNHKLLFVD
ncbi:hypothetical protein T08_9500 [Trichinella sp. T8]|nr:hypothetical protein T08_9500 [Trichinella sp. T8]